MKSSEKCGITSEKRTQSDTLRELEQSNRRIYTVLTICTFDAQRKMRYNKVAEKTAWSLKKE